MRIDHTFDWKGCALALGGFALCIGLMIGARIGAGYVLAREVPTNPPVMVVEHTPPAVAEFSSTTPQRVINALTIADTIPAQGKFIVADLVNMKITLYQDGTSTAQFPIVTKGRPGTAWETPSGFYAIQSKEESHFSSIGHVYMPYSMQFYGNYFIHGWTTYPDGTPVSASFSGGCIKLHTADAEKVFAFSDVGTKVFVYDNKVTTPPPPLSLLNSPPRVGALAYVVADVDTGDVYAEQDAQKARPVASATKLMTALVANEIISLDKKVAVDDGELMNPPTESLRSKTFLVDDLFYPLLMQSSAPIADSLASYYGRDGFVTWMNTEAKALDMNSTTFSDVSGNSPETISTPDDLFRLATYLAHKKSFVLKINTTQSKTITALDGTPYTIENIASSTDAGDEGTAVSVFSFPVGDETRQVAVIVMGSTDTTQDTEQFSQWLIGATIAAPQPACVSCTLSQYRKIQL